MKSVLQTRKECFICGAQTNLHDHHIIYGVANRKKSEKYGLKCFLCYEHHEGNTGVHHNPNKSYDLYLKQTAQEYYEEHYGSREDFIREFGKSFL